MADFANGVAAGESGRQTMVFYQWCFWARLVCRTFVLVHVYFENEVPHRSQAHK
jgi:hypothetical protein